MGVESAMRTFDSALRIKTSRLADAGCWSECLRLQPSAPKIVRIPFQRHASDVDEFRSFNLTIVRVYIACALGNY
jgi:hypothetical protein